MKKIFLLLGCIVLICFVFSACDEAEESKADISKAETAVSQAVSETESEISEQVSQTRTFIIVDYRDSHEFLDTGISTFYQDETYAYFFPMSQMHEYVIVEYSDGTTQNVKEAFADGNITIEDLDRFGIVYGKMEK